MAKSKVTIEEKDNEKVNEKKAKTSVKPTKSAKSDTIIKATKVVANKKVAKEPKGSPIDAEVKVATSTKSATKKTVTTAVSDDAKDSKSVAKKVGSAKISDNEKVTTSAIPNEAIQKVKATVSDIKIDNKKRTSAKIKESLENNEKVVKSVAKKKVDTTAKDGEKVAKTVAKKSNNDMKNKKTTAKKALSSKISDNAKEAKSSTKKALSASAKAITTVSSKDIKVTKAKSALSKLARNVAKLIEEAPESVAKLSKKLKKVSSNSVLVNNSSDAAKKVKAKTSKNSKAINENSIIKNALDEDEKEPEFVDIPEYYDLPYKYEKTVVKVLYQNPNTLFVYWDISDDDINGFKKAYGDNFFYITKPVLIIHNITDGYSFEIDVNDFANNWYVHVSDAKCKYNVELARRPSQSAKIENIVEHRMDDFINVSYSNTIEMPNDHILFFKNNDKIYFKNIKTNKVTEKVINLKRDSKHIKPIYSKYNLLDAEDKFDFNNPSSQNPTSNVMAR